MSISNARKNYAEKSGQFAAENADGDAISIVSKDIVDEELILTDDDGITYHPTPPNFENRAILALGETDEVTFTSNDDIEAPEDGDIITRVGVLDWVGDDVVITLSAWQVDGVSVGTPKTDGTHAATTYTLAVGDQTKTFTYKETVEDAYGNEATYTSDESAEIADSTP